MTVVILALLGGVIGAASLGEAGGFVLGVAIGGLMGFVADLKSRVRLLERRLDARMAAETRAQAQTPRPAAEAPRAPERTAEPEPPRVAASEPAPSSDERQAG